MLTLTIVCGCALSALLFAWVFWLVYGLHDRTPEPDKKALAGINLALTVKAMTENVAHRKRSA